MSIQLRYSEDFSEGLKRLMVEECQTSVQYLGKASTDEEKHKAAHESRKAFKKIRACLRLVRDHIDYYDQENTWFRDLGREIAQVRDATAHLETLELLNPDYSPRRTIETDSGKGRRKNRGNTGLGNKNTTF